MKKPTIPHPKVVMRKQWLAKRKKLLSHEKALTRERDRVNAERRRLPMVKLEKEYVFTGAKGRKSLLALFEGRRQLIIYHFMFDPAWARGCGGCTELIDALGDLSKLNEKDTTFAVVSRAPLAKLQAYRKKRGWDIRWYSSNGGDFNYDFHATLDPKVTPVAYNFKAPATAREAKHMTGEAHGISVFFRVDDEIYHTYSAYARGCESVTDAYSLLDLTPYGRQQDFEVSPRGWPQSPTYG